ncbi:MAG: DeoR family transcriptional regulator [Planctomycetota bacterium]|nr:MAG: DeoR family transcriptional regulator [Planctomycetota bacterium]
MSDSARGNPIPSNVVAFAPERRERVKQIVRSRHAVRVEDLKEELGVSTATIRRDLDELEGSGELRRVHGGAVSVEIRPIEARFEAKAAKHALAKQRIAARALELIEPDSKIYLDAGSTCLELARLLSHRTDITVVTNSLPAIVELAGQGPRLIVIGGELRPLSQAIVGPLSTPLLDELYVDRAFMGTFSLSLEAGLTTTDPAEAFTKERALTRAREVVLLVDGSKLGTRSFAHSGHLDQVDVVITDAELDEDAATAFEKADVRVLVA